jgi:hypothetical protein
MATRTTTKARKNAKATKARRTRKPTILGLPIEGANHETPRQEIADYIDTEGMELPEPEESLLAKQEVALYEDHSTRVKGELAELRKKIVRLTELLLDPDLPKDAKGVLGQQLGEAGRREAELQAALVAMGDRSNRDHGRLAAKVKQALGVLTDRLAVVASGAELNRLVEDMIGPSRVTVEGELLPVPETEPATAGAVAGVPVNIG